MGKRLVGKEGLSRHSLLVVFALIAFGLFARPAGAGTITIGWDLMPDTNVTGYRVYVGVKSGTYTETFDVSADSDFFIFRNAFMGVRYFFAVAAQFDGSRYGARSYEVSSVGTRTVAGSLPDGARLPDPALASGCGAECFVVTDVARGLGQITSLAVANDGSVFAVENGRRIVMLRDGRLVTAFQAESGTTLRDLALDPQFDTTGRVFVSVLRPRDRATGNLEVVRLRYLAGTLGEPAVIIGGLAVPTEASAPLTVGDDTLLYLALPSSLARDPYSAAVLAFDQDGGTPAGRSSPVIARGLEAPVDMAWDSQGRALWLVGRNAEASVQLLSVSSASEPAIGASNLVGDGETAVAVTVASGAARRLLVAAGPDLIEARPGSADVIRISLESYGIPVAVAARSGARYIATRDEGAVDAYRVVKVEDGSTSAAR
jgi:hypothetical protein